MGPLMQHFLRRGVYKWTIVVNQFRDKKTMNILMFLGYSGAIWCMAYVLASWNF